MSAHVANPILYSAQEILNESFNNTYKILQVAGYGYDAPSNSFIPAGAALTNRYDLQSPIYYVGSAPVGTLDTATGWTITKYDLTSNPYSGKVATASTWSTRVSGSYN